MKRLLLVLAVLVIAAPAFAGTWADGYTWSAQKYGGTKFLNNYSSDDTNAWGLGWEYSNPGAPWSPSQLQYVEWAADRTGNYQAQHDVMTENTGKMKWRTDTNWASLNAAGPGLSYSQSLGLCLGLKIGNSGGGYPAVYLRNSTGGAKIAYSTTAASVMGIDTNWVVSGSKTIVDGIAGNWTQAAGDWSYIKVVMSGDGSKTWHAYLNDESNHMWGHVTGDSGNYIQFGFLGGATSMDVTYDFVAFGTGDDNIGGIPQVPEPASIVALCSGLIGLVGLRRRK